MPQSPEAAADLAELNLNAAILIQSRRQAIEALRAQVCRLSPAESRKRLELLRKTATSEAAELPVYAHVATAWIDKHLRALRPPCP